MKKIYICDDELVYREQLSHILLKIIKYHDYPFFIAAKVKTTSELLSQSIDHSESIYFLDVNIVGSPITGFELGKEIRRRDPLGVIIFITTFEELAFETFRYRLEAMDYIIKDQPEKITERISLCLKSVIEKHKEPEKKQSETLTIKFGDELICFDISEILFIETSSRSHMVIVHTINQTVETAEQLQSLEKKLAAQFVRSHRSYLINLEFIKSVNMKNNTVELTTGHTCLVSRRMKKSLKERIQLNRA